MMERIRAILAEKRLLIADGHHRYATALAYRDAGRPDEARTLLADPRIEDLSLGKRRSSTPTAAS